MNASKRGLKQTVSESTSIKRRNNGGDYVMGYLKPMKNFKPSSSTDCRCCPICGFVVNGFSRLQKHLDKVHAGLKVSEVKPSSYECTATDKELNVTCSKCGLICESEKGLKEHRIQCTTNVLDFLANAEPKEPTEASFELLNSNGADKQLNQAESAIKVSLPVSENDNNSSTASIISASMKPGFCQLLCPLCKLYVFSLDELNDHTVKRHGYINCPICVYCSPMPNLVRHLTSAHPSLTTLLISEFTEADDKCAGEPSRNDKKKTDATKKVTCIICGLEMSLSQYMGHFVKCHSAFECTVNVCKCNTCPSTFKSFTEFRKHWAQEHDGFALNVDVLPIDDEDSEDLG